MPVSNKQIASLVKTLADLHAFFAQLVGLWKYVPPEFLASRPPYMPDHGDQAEPSCGNYPAMFEAFFTSIEHHSILLANATERDNFFNSFRPVLPLLAHGETLLRQMWYSYQADFYRKKRAEFKRHLRQLVIAEAMKPLRIATMLEKHGFDGLENTFGP